MGGEGLPEHHVLREAHMWTSMKRHPNVVCCHQAWVEVEHGPGVIGASAGWLPHDGAPSSTALPPDDASLGFSLGDGSSVEDDESDCDVIFVASDKPMDSGHNCSTVGATLGSPKCRGHTSPTELKLKSEDDENPQRRIAYHATLYIQMELCRKDTLQTWIARRNATLATGTAANEEIWWWAGDACDIFCQCVAALAHMHSSLCAHRDVKPSNILFAMDGSVLLGDFGLAKVVGDRPPPTPTHQYAMASAPCIPSPSRTCGVGTPSYASPEQLKGDPYGVETDIYALGMLFVELLCPVQTQMERAVGLERVRCGLGLPHDAAAAFPLAAQLVAAMTCWDPTERPTADELLQIAPKLIREARHHFRGDKAEHPSPASDFVRGMTIRGLSGDSTARDGSRAPL
mmetsp:Transcript_30109/g.82743  ORF Transcript_30109/g.82743 Transcript_30109/m.82743 type:complete len:401 (-) Transcript_30109:226-1428(-)